jgi:hypothetical protein
MAEVMARGSSFRGLLRAIEHRYGAATAERVLEELDGEAGSSLRFGQVIAVGWYPAIWYSELYASVERVLGGMPGRAAELGYQAVRDDFSTIHRMAVAMLTPEMLVPHAPRFLGFYYRGGQISAQLLGENRAEIALSGWKGFSRLVWYDLAGGCEAVLAACRAKHVRWKITNGGTDGSDMTVLFEWTR